MSRFGMIYIWGGVLSICLSVPAPPALSQASGSADGLRIDPVDSIVGPAVDPQPRTDVLLPLDGILLLRIEPGIPMDDDSVMTDGGANRPPQPPTEFERIKLDMAHEAVERARAAGTLMVCPEGESPVVPPQADIDAMKRLRALETPPAPMPPEPVEVGAPGRPLQERGPAGMTAEERAKLTAPGRPTSTSGTEGR